MVTLGAEIGGDCNGKWEKHEPPWGLLIFCVSVWRLFTWLDSVYERSSDAYTCLHLCNISIKKCFIFGLNKENNQICILLWRMRRTQTSGFCKVLGPGCLCSWPRWVPRWLVGTCGDPDVFATVLAQLPGAAFRDCRWICLFIAWEFPFWWFCGVAAAGPRRLMGVDFIKHSNVNIHP